MKSTILKVSILLIILTASCKRDFLTKTPLSNLSVSNFYTSASDAEAALAGVYDVLGNHQDDSGFGTYFRGLLIMGNVGTDEMYTDLGFGGSYAFDNSIYTINSQSAISQAVWKWQYIGISRANTLLASIDAINMDANRKNEIKGEALFLRGFFYFQLARFYGGVPITLNPVNSPSEINYTRNTLKEVYTQIISDLEMAENLLPDTKYQGHANKGAAIGMQANVYLQMSGEPLKEAGTAALASKKAQQLIDLNRYRLLPDYGSVFNEDNKNNDEIIFDVQFIFCGVCEGGQVGTWFGNGGNFDATASYNIALSYPTLFRSYNNNDKRKSRNVKDFIYTTTTGQTQQIDYAIFASKFGHPLTGRNYFEWQSPSNYPILRYADILLIQAEAENRANNAPTPKAYEDVRLVRQRANLGPLTPNLNFDQFNNALLAERSFELCFEGKRWFDLVRFGKLLEVVKSVPSGFDPAYQYAKSAQQAADNITARNVLMPIPQRDIDLSKGKLTQNTGY